MRPELLPPQPAPTPPDRFPLILVATALIATGCALVFGQIGLAYDRLRAVEHTVELLKERVGVCAEPVHLEWEP